MKRMKDEMGWINKLWKITKEIKPYIYLLLNK